MLLKIRVSINQENLRHTLVLVGGWAGGVDTSKMSAYEISSIILLKGQTQYVFTKWS